MDDFERGAREMQRVAAEALDEQASITHIALNAISKGINPYRWTALREREEACRQAASMIRSIKIQDTVDG